MRWVFVTDALLEMLAALTVTPAATGPWLAAKAGLFTNTITLGPGTVYTDLTKPTWTGYANATVTWLTPTATGGGAGELLGTPVVITSNADADTVIHGVFLATSALGLICAGILDDDLPVVGVQNILIDLPFVLPSS
jgi:hypothetical protein